MLDQQLLPLGAFFSPSLKLLAFHIFDPVSSWIRKAGNKDNGDYMYVLWQTWQYFFYVPNGLCICKNGGIAKDYDT